MAWFDFLTSFGKLIKKALGLAKDAGLTDDVVDLALKWVRVAASKTIDNSAKRQLVVDLLMAKGVPESIARLATELAYRLYKTEIAPKIGS